MGFEEATHIQEEAIPLAMQGKDIIGQAQTGTGKTAAFGIPMIQNCDPSSENIQGIVIAPTRELAVQVAEELNKIGQFMNVSALPIYGGQDFKWQLKALKNKPSIIVGTPGRLLDHIIHRKSIKLDHIKTLVLDEADEMLDMGFIEDIESILGQTPPNRQTMLFSATISPVIRKLAKKYMIEPVSVGGGAKKVDIPVIAQHYIEVLEAQKFDVLCRLFDTQSPEMAIVFGRTKKRVDEIQDGLIKRGYTARGLHGDLDQSRRDSVMKQFRDGRIQVLVATDVASRGLDISGVTHIYNFDIPQDIDRYVHRIGRTGRAGKSGMSVTFITPREHRLLKAIEQVTGQRLIRLAVPTLDDAIRGQQRIVLDNIMRIAESGEASKYTGVAEMLLNQNDSVTILAAALKILVKEPDTTPVRITDDMPEKSRGGRGYRGEQRRSGDSGDRRRPSEGYHRSEREKVKSESYGKDNMRPKKVFRKSLKK